jgi:hypothetical protein
LSQVKSRKAIPELERFVLANWNFAEVTVFQRANEMALVLEDSSGLTIESNFLRKLDWRCTDGKLLEILI